MKKKKITRETRSVKGTVMWLNSAYNTLHSQKYLDARPSHLYELIGHSILEPWALIWSDDALH